MDLCSTRQRLERGQFPPKRLILAAANYADGEGEKPRELELYEQCVYWRTLPRAGGILDQPFGLLDRMKSVQNVVELVQNYNANWTIEGWLDQNPTVLKWMSQIWTLREEENGGTIET